MAYTHLMSDEAAAGAAAANPALARDEARIVAKMDDDLREATSGALAPCDHPVFLAAYQRLHALRYGVPLSVDVRGRREGGLRYPPHASLIPWDRKGVPIDGTPPMDWEEQLAVIGVALR